MNSEHLTPHGRNLLDRRNFLRNTAGTLGGLGLAQLLAKDGYGAAGDPTQFSGKAPIRPDIDPDNPYHPRPGHFDGAAKQVLVIYCPGAVSHVDTFDYKPALEQFHGQKPPGIPAVTFEGPTGNIAKPFWEFKPRGESGKMTSELLPNLGKLADDFCFIHSLTTQTSAHPQGENFFNTGFTMEGFPSFGAIYNVNPAAGGGESSGLWGKENHARRPAVIRGHRLRFNGCFGSRYLYEDRQHTPFG